MSTGTAGAQDARFAELHLHLLSEARAGWGQMLFADLDRDRDTDVILAGLLLRNDGRGAFQSSPWAGSNASRLISGDVDADGDIDMVGLEGSNLAYYSNSGGASFSTNYLFPTPNVGAPLDLFDAEGDGDLDLLVGAGTNCDDPVSLYRYRGSRGFELDSAALPPETFTAQQAVAVGDVDGDGDQDLLLQVTPCFATGLRRPALYLNDGRGSFSPSGIAMPTTDHPVPRDGYLLRDLDGDGAPDLLVSGSSLQLAWNDGRGGFVRDPLALPPQILPPGESPYVVDLDLDGDLDLALQRNYVLWSNGARRFTLGAALLPSEGTFGLADLDGDGDADAIQQRIQALGNSTYRGSTLYLNDGVGNLALADPLVLGSPDHSAAGALSDIDRDGDLDLFVGNAAPDLQSPFPDPCRLHLNEGNGTFSAANSWLPLIGERVSAVAAGDLDRDGDTDFLLGSETGAVLLLRNQVSTSSPLSARFARVPVASIGVSITSIALGDVDGDRDLDAILGTGIRYVYPNGPAAAAPNVLLLNDGEGGFRDASAQLPTGAENTNGLALGDVDSDGDLDLAIGNSTNNQGGPATLELFLNDGSGRFTDASSVFSGPVLPTADVHPLDLDRDGDLDLVAGGYGRLLHIFRGDGAGGFVEDLAAAPYSDPFTTSGRLTPIDLDDDGDLDFVTAQLAVLIQQQNGTFSRFDRTLPAISATTYAVPLSGDLDGDMDSDLVLVRGRYGPVGENLVLSNLTRQLGWRATPLLGKRQTLDLYATPLAPVLLFGSGGRASIPVPPLGNLLLDPASLALVASLQLDSRGRGAFSAPVPFDLSLLGVSLYWQALFGPAPRFSNLEITRFRAL